MRLDLEAGFRLTNLSNDHIAETVADRPIEQKIHTTVPFDHANAKTDR
jgi:hypothetical protein